MVASLDEFASTPRTAQWLASLPDGLDSYPECQVKGSMVRGYSEFMPEGVDLQRLPAPVRDLVTDPPLVSAWISETKMIALCLAFRELYFETDAGYLSWVEESLETMLAGRLYRVLFSVISPARMAKSAAKRWKALRLGTRREMVEFNDNGNLGRITYPENLYHPLYVEITLRGFMVIYRMSKAPAPVGRIVSHSPTAVLLEVRYDAALPRCEDCLEPVAATG